jgi:integrase
LRVSLGRDPLNSKRYIQQSRMFPATGKASKTEAKRALQAFELEAMRSTAGASTTTFRSMCERWLEINKADWGENTYSTNERLLKMYVYPALGELTLRRLETETFDRFYMALTKKGLSPGSVRRIHSVCSPPLELALRWKIISHNPAKDAKKPKAARSLKSQRDLPELEDVLKVFDAAMADDDVWGRLVLSKVGIGARRGEVVAIQRRAIDFATGFLRVDEQIIQPGNGSVLMRKKTKQDSQRTFKLDPATLAVLKTQWEFVELRAKNLGIKLKPTAYLWSDVPDCTVPWKPDRVTQRFVRMRDKYELKLRLHDLRHLNGTHLSAMGVDIATIAKRLGHSRTSTTLNFYVEPVNAGDDNAAKLLGERLARG